MSSSNPFKNKESKCLVRMREDCSFSYLGGGSFYYVLPGKKAPLMGKFNLRQGRGGLKLLVAVILAFVLLKSLLFIADLSVFNSIGNRAQISQGSSSGKDKIQTERRFDKLEQDTEKAKSQLYVLQKPVAEIRAGNVKIKKYTIQSGDTLSGLALQHRVPATLIAASSKISYHSILKPGQQVLIPERPGIVYLVKKGDIPAAILNKYRVKLAAFTADNPGLPTIDLIEPGTKIFLPNAKLPKPVYPWARPIVGRYSSRFGWRRHPIFRRRHFHTGVDIAVFYKNVRAAKTGRVVYTGYLGSYGKVVMVRHDNRFKTLYAHLSRIKVRTGAYVSKGRVIAVSGNTGRSTGPHLHFEVIRDGRPVNPRRYIRF